MPTNAYPCLPTNSADPKSREYIVIGANGDSIYNRLMATIGRTDLIGPDYQHNQHRVERQAEIELAISSWTEQRTAEEIIDAMNEAQVPVGRVVNVKDIVENEHIQSRGAVRDVKFKDWSVKMAGTFPVLDGVDSQPKWAGPDLGEHTDDVLSQDLNLSKEEIDQLRKEGIIG